MLSMFHFHSKYSLNIKAHMTFAFGLSNTVAQCLKQKKKIAII